MRSLNHADKQRLKVQYGPWAVVTGASSGIGRELASQLASAGLHLVLNARREQELVELAQKLEKEYNIQTRIISGDLTNPLVLQTLFEASQTLDVGLIIPCAGYGSSGLFSTSDLDNEVNMLRLNCEVVLKMTHHFVGRFKNRARSGIIFISSIVAFQGVPYSAHYSATKAWVQSMAEGLSDELKAQNIDVLSAIPGPILSDFSTRADMQMQLFDTPEDIGAPILKALGKRRSAVPGKVGKLLVYSLRTVPRWAKTRILKLVMAGMTAHQRG